MLKFHIKIVGKLVHSSKSHVIYWTPLFHYCQTWPGTEHSGSCFLGNLRFVHGDMIRSEKQMVLQDRYSIKTKGKNCSSPCLSEHFPVPQASGPQSSNFIITFSDGDLFPRAKLLTLSWTNMNIQTGPIELNVGNTGCGINSSWINFLCRVTSTLLISEVLLRVPR